MLDNHLYNLLLQLTEENKSLWRIKDEYLNDSKGCSECEKFWKKMEQEKEQHVKELAEMVKKHMVK
jgi:hypothetical protein